MQSRTATRALQLQLLTKASNNIRAVSTPMALWIAQAVGFTLSVPRFSADWCAIDSARFLASAHSTGLSRPLNSTRVANHTSVSFEEYWCAVVNKESANTPDSYPDNGSVGPPLYGLNTSVKDYCLSLEKANYSSWAATASPSILTNIDEFSTVWQPTRTQPCCDTFCNIAAATAQLLYWPTPAPFPNATTVVGTDGFTL